MNTPLTSRPGFALRKSLPLPVAAARVTTRAPFVRERLSVPTALALIVLATLPAWAIGVWSAGTEILIAAGGHAAETLAPWRRELVRTLPDLAAPFGLGLSYFLPLLIAVYATGVVWETLFARLRRRPVDCGIFYTAWLMVLMLPAGASPLTAVVGASFAFIVGKLLFGGTGRYLLNPALLGIVFLNFAYPDTPSAVTAFPLGAEGMDTGLDVALNGGLDGLRAAGLDFHALALGRDLGTFGGTSALACAAGALFLVLAGLVSWRIIVACLAGSFLMTLALNGLGPEDPAFDLPWHWHLVTGSFAFLVAFIATDPTAAAVTRAGRWIYGLVIGAAAILFRVANSSHPEGTLYAVLLIGLAAPAIDHAVIAWQMRRHRRRVSR